MQVVVADLYEEGFNAMRQCTCVRTDVADPASVEEMIEKTVQALKPHRCARQLRRRKLGHHAKGPARLAAAWLSRPAPTARSRTGAPSSPPTSTAVFYCSRAAAPHLKKQGGAIVNVASVAARKGIPPAPKAPADPMRWRRRASWASRASSRSSSGLRRARELRRAGRDRQRAAEARHGAHRQGARTGRSHVHHPDGARRHGRGMRRADRCAMHRRHVLHDGVTVDVNGASYAA